MILIWQKLTSLTLLTSIISGCAAIPGKNVKLNDYPDNDPRSLNKITLHYDYTETHAGLTSDAYGNYYNFFQKTAPDKSNYPLERLMMVICDRDTGAREIMI